MKKVILFVFFVLSTFYYGYSQSLTLADSTGPLTNNANVTRLGHSDGIDILSYFFVHNTTSATVAVKVKKVEISLIAGSVNTFCWAGLCYGPNTYVSRILNILMHMLQIQLTFQGITPQLFPELPSFDMCFSLSRILPIRFV